MIYEDEGNQIKEEFSKWFQGSETWDWSMRLREGATTEFKYRYFVQYTDGLVFESELKTANSGEDIPPIDIKRYKQSLTIDAGLLDWTKWRMVYATVSYEDEANKYTKQETIRLDQDNFMKSFEIFSFHPGGNEYDCKLKFAGAGKVIDAKPQTAKGGILILEDPEAETEPVEPAPEGE